MRTDATKWKQHLMKALIVVLVIMVCISILQWFVIIALFGFGTEMLKDAMVRQAPEDVDRLYIVNTLDRVRNRAQQLPFSFIAGKINLSKLKAAGEYAIEANDDEIWSAEEITTLLRFLNASVGYKRETE